MPITVPFSNCLRLRGRSTGRCLVRTVDLHAGQRRLSFAGSIVPDFIDPDDPFSLCQALEFCTSLIGELGPPSGSQPADRHWRDLESRIRRAWETGEIALISEAMEPGAPYRVACAATPRSTGNAWQVYGDTRGFLIVPRKGLLPGEQPVQGSEVRDVIESLLTPQAELPVATILTWLQGNGPGGPAGLRSRLEAAFRIGELILVVLKRDAGGTSSAREAADDSAPPARANPSQSASEKLDWVEFRVIDITTGKAVPGVQLEVTLADASKQKCATDGNGAIRFDDTTPGDCALRAGWKDLRMEDVYSFVRTEI